MVDTIHSITTMVDQDPNVTKAGQVDREKSPGKDKAPQGSTGDATASGEWKIPAGNVREFSEVVQDINTLVHQVASTKISFDVDDDTGRAVVRVLNKETGEVIRQVPPEELLTLVARMRQLSGLIFNQEV
jgi:flagellar protein FlaG